jgi:predicted DNA-binding transcriptional regulator AlpA
MSAVDLPADVYLKAAQVRERFGSVSDMWLHRRMHDAVLPFPAPEYFGGDIRFWKLADIVGWEAARKAADANRVPREIAKPTPHKRNAVRR